jgi:hypothetical protein
MTYSWITGVEVETTHHKCTLDITEQILNPIVILKVLNGSGDNIRAPKLQQISILLSCMIDKFIYHNFPTNFINSLTVNIG